MTSSKNGYAKNIHDIYGKEFRLQRNLKHMKIFVTGGAGFIGRNLVESLLSKDNKVTIFDNFANSSKNQVSQQVKKQALFVKGDVLDYASLAKSLRGFDCVVHLAAQIDVQQSILHPERTHQVNVTGTVNLLRACAANKVKNIVAASTAAVFGNPERLPLDENSKTVPLSPYGASKLSMEHYLQAFANSYDLNCISLRFFNAYGIDQSIQYAGVITRFMDKILKNKPLEIYGDGSNTRDFVSIDDIVQSIKRAIQKIDGKKGTVYNIASGKSIAIKDLARMMILISGKNIAIKYHPSKKGDIEHSRTSILFAKKELGYSPQVNLKEGLKNLLASDVKK